MWTGGRVRSRCPDGQPGGDPERALRDSHPVLRNRHADQLSIDGGRDKAWRQAVVVKLRWSGRRFGHLLERKVHWSGGENSRRLGR